MVFCWNMFPSGGLLGFSQCHGMMHKKRQNQQDQGSKRTDCGCSSQFPGRVSKNGDPKAPRHQKGSERIKDQQGSTRRKTLQETVYAGMTLQAEIEQLSLAAVFSERASDDDRHVLNRISSLCHANTTHHEHFTS